MTTKVIIQNDRSSNGDLQIKAVNVSLPQAAYGTHDLTLYPSEWQEVWLTTSGCLFITETWPTKKPVEQAQEDEAKAA